MKPLSELVRPNIWALAPYSTARDDYQGGDIDVWLDANENPYDTEWNRYPDPHQRALKARISEIKGLPVDQIFIGNGSDEAIDLAYRIFCTPGKDNAVVMAPSYGMYSVAADTNDVEVREVLLNPDFSLPVDRMLAAADERTKLMIICSPNNPTGNAFPLSEIERLLDSFDGIVVVDEAYIDFSDKGSVLSVLAKHPNAIVLQTLSKAWGMAALRVGLAFASAEIMALYAKVKYPYNISKINQVIALGSLASVDEQVAEIKAERERLAKALKKSPNVIEVYPSDANFLLIKVDDANAWYDRLMAAGIIVRNRTKMPLCDGCLRITIGTPEENDKVIKVTKVTKVTKVPKVPKALSDLNALNALNDLNAPNAPNALSDLNDLNDLSDPNALNAPNNSLTAL